MDVLKRMPWMAQEAVFQKLASIADVTSLNTQERQAYDENLRKYRDTVAVLEGQWIEGHAKGSLDKALESARSMKADKMPVELIAKYTGLDMETVTQL
jgi:hypothetical protein